MAPELSSNWKKLQASIQPGASGKPAPKRKKSQSASSVGYDETLSTKRLKTGPFQDPGKLNAKRASTSQTKPVPSMGAAQSTATLEHTESTITPSLSLWAEDNDISPEDLAEAYALGLKDNAMLTSSSCKPNDGLAKGHEPGKYIALDCEMVGVGDRGYENALGRVSIVDFHGRQVYDSFVRPKEYVTDWRTKWSGVSPKHMTTARQFEDVQSQVAQLIKDRIIVGHDIRHDLDVLMLTHPPKMIRDTSKLSVFKKFGTGPKPSLRALAKEILGVEIQQGAHSSIEDARATMMLFRRYKHAFDLEIANRYPDRSALPPTPGMHAAKAKQKKKKRKN